MEFDKDYPRTYQIDADDSNANKMRRLSEAMYPSAYQSAEIKMKKFREIDVEAWKAFPLKRKLSALLKGRSKDRRLPFFRIIINSDGSKDNAFLLDVNRHIAEVTAEELKLITDWFEVSGHAAWLREKAKCFLKLMEELPKSNRKRGHNLYEILGLS